MHIFSPREILATELTGTHLLVAMILADYANEDGCCFPSTAMLRFKTKLSERRLREIMSDLRATGAIDIIPRYESVKATGASRQTSNLYVLKGEWIEESKARHVAANLHLLKGAARANAEMQARMTAELPLEVDGGDIPPGGEGAVPPGRGGAVPPGRGGAVPPPIEDSTKEAANKKGGSREGATPAKPPKRKTATPQPIPVDWFPDEEQRTKDKAKYPHRAPTWFKGQVELFRNRHIARAETSADWHANWRTWLINAERFRLEDITKNRRTESESEDNPLRRFAR